MSVRSLLMAAASSSAVTAVIPHNGKYYVPCSSAPGSSFSVGKAVAFGNNIYVAFQPSNSIYWTSVNGSVWTNRTFPVAFSTTGIDAVFGNGIFVVSGFAANSVYTSPDGINWTLRSNVGLTPYYLAFGNGIFVAQTGGSNTQVATSTDGINWTLRAVIATAGFGQGVVFGNDRFCAVFGNSISAASTDGINWTSGTVTSGLRDGGLASNGAMFCVITASGSTSRYSTDGLNWTSSPVMPTNSYSDLIGGNGYFLAIRGTNGTSAHSPDGINWTTLNYGLPTVTGMTGDFANGRFFIFTPTYNWVSVSGIGFDWTARTLPANVGTTWNPSDKTASVALSGSNLVATFSSTGGARSIFSISSGKWIWDVTLTSGSAPCIGVANASANLSTIFANSTGAAVVYTGSLYVNNVLQSGKGFTISTGQTVSVAVDMNAKLIWFRYSATGQWNGSSTNNPSTNVGGIDISALGSPLYALVAANANPVYTTNFGSTAVNVIPTYYTPGFGSAIFTAIRSVNYANGRYVATGVSPLTYYSIDGLNWNNGGSLPFDDNGGGACKPIFGNGIWLLMRYGIASTTVDYATSNDNGLTWTPRATGLNTAWGTSQTFGAGLFITTTYSASAIYATSPDGITWTQRSLPISAGWYINYVNGIFFAFATTPRLYTSTDGINWTLQANPPTYTSLVEYCPDTGIYCSTSMVSFDGMTWANRATNPSTGGRTDVIGLQDKFIIPSRYSTCCTTTDYINLSMDNGSIFAELPYNSINNFNPYSWGAIATGSIAHRFNPQNTNYTTSP